MWQVGLSSAGEQVFQQVSLVRVDPPDLPFPSVPRHRETNVGLLRLDDYAGTIGGVLADRRGRVLALWASFPYQSGREVKRRWRGLPIEVVVDTRERNRSASAIHWPVCSISRAVALSAGRK